MAEVPGPLSRRAFSRRHAICVHRRIKVSREIDPDVPLVVEDRAALIDFDTLDRVYAGAHVHIETVVDQFVEEGPQVVSRIVAIGVRLEQGGIEVIVHVEYDEVRDLLRIPHGQDERLLIGGVHLVAKLAGLVCNHVVLTEPPHAPGG